MKIIHIANFQFKKNGQAFYYNDHRISAGFIQEDHYTYDFSYRDEARNASFFNSKKMGVNKMNNRLIQICHHIRPDLLMFGKAELIREETLATLKKLYPKMKMALWHVDAIYYKKEINYISQQLQYLDKLFITTGGKDLAHLRKKHPNKIFFFPNPVSKSIDCYKNFEQDNFKYDVLFCGNDSKRPKRRQYFQELVQKNNARLRLSLHGVLDNPPKKGNDYFEILRQSPMGLNISDRFDIEYYSSDRIAHLTGNGLCTFSPQVPFFEKLYSKNEIIYYNSIDDLVEKLLFYKKNPRERAQIAKAGWKRAQNDYSSSRITRYFIDAIFENALKDYHWAGY